MSDVDRDAQPFNYDTPFSDSSGMTSSDYSVVGTALESWRLPNTDDWQTAGSPNKRRRTEGSDDESDSGSGKSDVTVVPNNMAEMSEPLVHDPDWYKETGDCVIRVEDTLFKVSSSFDYD